MTGKQVDTEAAAFMLGMSPNAFRVWVHRHPNQIRRVDTGSKGRALYDLDDVERVQSLRRLAIAA